MGTDRIEVGRGKCPCGHGEIVVHECSPDHAWASGNKTWWTGELNCGTCRNKYDLFSEDYHERMKLVCRPDLAERELRQQAWHEKRAAIMNSPRVRDLLGRFANRLDQEKSVAAKYRLVMEFDLFYGVEGTFRRHFNGSKAFASDRSPHDLPRILALLGEKHQDITAEVEELDELWKAMSERVPAVDTGIAALITF